jgi:hypothetical protein
LGDWMNGEGSPVNHKSRNLQSAANHQSVIENR